jgi:hypothetical protein
MILGAISVDAAVVFLGQRELGDAVAAAANDAAGAAFAAEPFYEGGQVELDSDLARRIAEESIEARAANGFELVAPPVVIVSGRLVCVTAVARVQHVFARAVPGAARGTTIRASSTATLAGTSAAGSANRC